MGAAALPRAIGILRVSRQNRNEDSRESPEVQRRLITRFAGPQGQGWDLIEILDENELRNGNVSGGGEISKRLGFSAAIKRIEAGKADLIVVADHGRLFRDIDVQRAAIDRVEGAGGQLWAVCSGRITHETADAELIANLKGSIDHYQRRYAREKSFLAVELAIEKGKVPWPGEIPGYIRDADSRLTPDGGMVAVIGGRLRPARTAARSTRCELTCWRMGSSSATPLRSTCLGIASISARSTSAPTRPTWGRAADHWPRAVRRGAEDQDLARQARELRPAARADRGPAVRELRLADGHRHEQQRELPRVSLPRQRLHSADDDLGRHGGRMVIEKVEELRACRSKSVRGACDAIELARLDVERARAALAGAIMAFSGLEVEPAAIRRLRELREGRDAAQERYVALEAAYAQSDFAATTGPWDSLSLQEQRNLVRALIKQVLITPGRGRQRVDVQEMPDIADRITLELRSAGVGGARCAGSPVVPCVRWRTGRGVTRS